jgi:hypothetical protein
MTMRRSGRRGFPLALGAAALALLACSPAPSSPASPSRHLSRCEQVASDYGLTPCPQLPLPIETVTVKNSDPAIGDQRAQELAQAYLRSRALYYQALEDNSVKFFRSQVIYLPRNSPLLFAAEIRHLDDARARNGRLVVQARSTMTSITVLSLTPELRSSIGGHVLPLVDALMVSYVGPDQQAIEVPGRPSQPVTEMEPTDSVQQLIAGVLLKPAGLEETWAEVVQWDCHDPDVSDLCGVDAG